MQSADGSTHRLKVKQILHGCSVHYSGHMGRLCTRPGRQMYIFGVGACVCVCVRVYMSDPHGSGFHHHGSAVSRNNVIHHVNAVITHHYPEVQLLTTSFRVVVPPSCGS